MKNKIIYFSIAFLATINIYAQTYFKEGYFVDNDKNKVECLIKYQNWKKSPTGFNYKLDKDSDLSTKNIDEISEFKIYETAKYYKRFRLDVNIYDDQLNLIKKEGDIIFLRVLFEADETLYVFEDKMNIFFYGYDNQLHFLKYAKKNLNLVNIELFKNSCMKIYFAKALRLKSMLKLNMKRKI